MPRNKYYGWLKAGLFNLALVALYGLLMRYKIAFDFPYLDQRNLLHAHSHFAFAGWVTHLLYCGLAMLAEPFLPEEKKGRYHVLLAANLVCAFGMLAAFTVQGYKAVSITFSTLTIVVSVAFAWVFIRDRKYFPVGYPAVRWAVAGLLLNVISSLGPFVLAYMMATKNMNSDLYLGSIYFYLHFQYNGWFFFGAAALVISHIGVAGRVANRYFRIFAGCVAPTFFLSILWVELPPWLYVITAGTALLQLIAWGALVSGGWQRIRQAELGVQLSWVRLLFYVPILALTLKFVLQAVSVIPDLSQLVFGFRPIVIAYLHLVLLAVYSIFLLGYLFAKRLIAATAAARYLVFAFLTGVLLNELFLGIQGAAAFSYFPVPYINEMLVGAAGILFVSAAGLWMSQLRKE